MYVLVSSCLACGKGIGYIIKGVTEALSFSDYSLSKGDMLMIKKVFTVLLGLLVAGTMISVDCSDAAVKRNRVRPRTVSKPVTQPAPTATQQTTAAPAAAATATAPKTTTAPAATAQGMPYGQTMAPGQTMAAPQSQGSGMGSALLGVGAGLAGGYLLNSALSGSDATAATAAAPAEGGQSAVAAAPAPAAAPASPVANLLGYDTANYCTQLSQGNADVMQQCTAAEAAATAAFRQCVAMSTGLNGIGSYDALLRCLRGTPAAQ